MPNKLMESASSAVYGVLARIIAIAVFFCVTAGQAAAITLTGYYKNATLQTLMIGVTGDSFEFGGCSKTVNGVAPNISGSVSTTSCVSTGAQMFAMRTDGVSARFCYKMSTASLADAATKACSNDPATENGSRSAISYATIYVVIEEVILSCSSQNLSWGGGNYCVGSAASSPPGTVLALTNVTSGANGSATATCSNGAWALSATTCTTNIAAPTSLSATDGTVTGKITVTWAAATGATGYDLQYRKVGDVTWTAGTGTISSGWQLAPADESPFEFQVRGKNATGTGSWSASETGFIRKNIDPQFVSQSGIPAKIGVGQSFTFSQIWQNNGAETWTGGAHGTGNYSGGSAIDWGIPFTAFAGSTATGAQVTTTLTATAPAVGGTYTLQRIMQKSGVSYGIASTAASILVLDTPKCTAAIPDITTTYNPNASITVSLTGASSVEAASIRVWGEAQGEASGVNYAMSYNGTSWVSTFPITTHLSAGESKVNIAASVSNSMFASTVCANTAVAFQQLPVPQVNLVPVLGSFDDSGNQGFVARRASGEFARATVDLGAFSSLKVKLELLSPNLTDSLGATLNSVSAGVATALNASSTVTGAGNAAWSRYPAVIKVSYADPDAASQGKVTLIPVTLTIPPIAMQVSALSEAGLPASVNSRVHNAGSYDEATFGLFTGALRTHPEQTVVRDFAATDSNGAWSSQGLDYASLYSQNMVAVARVTPPAGVTLLEVIEYTSAPFLLPVQAPTTVSATDGSREDDVAINWVAPATGPDIRYRLFRGDTEITQAGGIAALEFIDIPPQRGAIYQYRVKTMINGATSQNEAADNGNTPACRAARLIGASINADMSAITGLVERWDCLEGLTGAGAVDAGGSASVAFEGAGLYRSFTYPLESNLADGAHVLHLGLESAGVGVNASRSYDVPFSLDRSSITVNSLTILYNGQPATNGVEANSIGRFGIRMEGGGGIGFAEEVQ